MSMPRSKSQKASEATKSKSAVVSSASASKAPKPAKPQQLRTLLDRIVEARRSLAELERQHRQLGGDPGGDALGPTWVLYDFVERASEPVHPADAARELHLDAKIVRTLLGNLAVAGKLSRPSFGAYSVKRRGDAPVVRRAPGGARAAVVAFLENHAGPHSAEDIHKGTKVTTLDTITKLLPRLATAGRIRRVERGQYAASSGRGRAPAKKSSKR